MAGKSYIYIISDPENFESNWSLAKEKLNEIVNESGEQFMISVPEGRSRIVIDLMKSLKIDIIIKKIVSLTNDQVIGFTYETSIDGFAYWNYKGRELVRYFDYGFYGEEREWNELTGSPEPWEEEVFFSKEEEEAQMEDIDELEEEEKDELIEIYKGKKLKKGSCYPCLGGSGSLKIPLALGFPGIKGEFVPERKEIIERSEKPGFFSRLFGFRK